ncbi:hypothetical protein CA54_17050 [Symmachiella macrocystis]|uniref:DUF6378 domain-containing protein n=1 Tax=Symmachiella macrocystis TaxID=2527985 RepID=A0A5C6BPF2_9PLAN|nr:DUF6378 domain-containing protein [Symmachiella macrocystis]TWU12879.1 hypothetical protein CA54_17050 [Symmachiella macrocystis]
MSGMAQVINPAAASILAEAELLTAKNRQEAYGDYREQSRDVAAVWSVLTGVAITPRMVPLMMAALKLVRESGKPKRDNRVDACGYLHLLDQLPED